MLTESGFSVFNLEITFIVIFQSVVVLLIAIIVNYLINIFLKNKVKTTQNRYRKNLLYSFIYIKTYIICIIAVVTILQIFGVSLTWLIASSAALAVAFGLGIQQIVSNYVSGATLIFSEWFSVGDVIQIQKKTGKITKITLRNTHLITPLGENIIIPNSRFLSDIFHNWSGGGLPKLVEINVSVSYGTDLEKTKRILVENIKSVKNINPNFEPIVLLNNFGGSSIELAVRVSVDDIFNEIKTKSDVRFVIEKTLRENSIQIPFPQRDIHMKD